MADQILDYRNIQFDEAGKPFWTTQSGKRSYLPPASAAQSGNPRAVQWAASQGEVIANGQQQTTAAPSATFAKSQGAWNPQTGQFDQGMNMSGLGGAITGGAALAAPLVIGPAIANALGGSAALGSFDAAPSISSPVGAANAQALGATAAGGNVATGASGGGGLAGMLKGLVSPQNIPQLVGLGTSLLGGLTGGGSGGGSNPDLDRMRAITEARMRRVDPLHQAITSLAMSRMPTAQQRPLPDVKLPE